jgi:WRKY transcription factor 22
MEEDWDLQAVVRGCVSTASRATTTTSTVTTTTTAAATTSFLPDFHSNYSYFSGGNQQQQVGQGQGQGQGRLFSFSDPFEVRHVSEDLHELCKPFFLKPQPLSPQLSPLITPFSNSLSSFAVSKAQTPPPTHNNNNKHNIINNSNKNSSLGSLNQPLTPTKSPKEGKFQIFFFWFC